jgi:hypothetical protein
MPQSRKILPKPLILLGYRALGKTGLVWRSHSPAGTARPDRYNLYEP